MTGAPFLPPGEWPELVPSREAAPQEVAELPSPSWQEVSPLIEERCAGCHRDEQWGLNPLTYDSLLGAKSTQTDQFLVRAGDPQDSYLMRKILPDYPEREFTVQPPPWSDVERLDRQELLLIEGWIAAGARR